MCNDLTLYEQKYNACTECELATTRTNIVLGAGSPQATILYIGNYPDIDEDQCGNIEAGGMHKLLTDKDHGLFTKAGISADHVYITHALACRACSVDPETDEIETRAPTVTEINACRPRLFDLIYTLDPTLIITAGATALRALTRNAKSVTQLRGDFATISVPGQYDDVKYSVMITLHPVDLLRIHDTERDGLIAKTIEDLALARKIDQHIIRRIS